MKYNQLSNDEASLLKQIAESTMDDNTKKELLSALFTKPKVHSILDYV